MVSAAPRFQRLVVFSVRVAHDSVHCHYRGVSFIYLAATLQHAVTVMIRCNALSMYNENLFCSNAFPSTDTKVLQGVFRVEQARRRIHS